MNIFVKFQENILPMKIKFFACLTLGSLIISLLATAAPNNSSQNQEKTAFQTSDPWKQVTDVRSDVVIVCCGWEHCGPNCITLERWLP